MPRWIYSIDWIVLDVDIPIQAPANRVYRDEPPYQRVIIPRPDVHQAIVAIIPIPPLPRILVGVVAAPRAAFDVTEGVERRRLGDALCVVAQLPRAAQPVTVVVFVTAAVDIPADAVHPVNVVRDDVAALRL
ncbi:MAG: hypothetical protein NZT92_14830, partial [Abditibacteriales bacterium]|nr:hypothetical protein [Abditibacteriales bacterium]